MILVISGTNRKGSNSLKVAQHLEGYIQGHPDRQEAQVIDLATLPSSLMDPEIYAKKPPEFEPLVQAVLNSDGIMVVPIQVMRTGMHNVECSVSYAFKCYVERF